MEEVIAILAEFRLDEMNLIKYTLHEEAIATLLKWKTRQVKRQNQEVDEDGKLVQKAQEPKVKEGPNTVQDLALCQQLFTSGG